MGKDGWIKIVDENGWMKMEKKDGWIKMGGRSWVDENG